MRGFYCSWWAAADKIVQLGLPKGPGVLVLVFLGGCCCSTLLPCCGAHSGRAKTLSHDWIYKFQCFQKTSGISVAIFVRVCFEKRFITGLVLLVFSPPLSLTFLLSPQQLVCGLQSCCDLLILLQSRLWSWEHFCKWVKLYSGSEPPPQLPNPSQSPVPHKLTQISAADQKSHWRAVAGHCLWLACLWTPLGVSGRISRLFSLGADVRLNKRSFVLLPCDAAPSWQGAALSSPVSPVFVRDNFCSRAVVFIGNIWLWFLPCSDFDSGVKLSCC